MFEQFVFYIGIGSFIALNSIFFYIKGYNRASKDNKVISEFTKRASGMVDDAVSRGAMYVLAAFEENGIIETTVSDRAGMTKPGSSEGHQPEQLILKNYQIQTLEYEAEDSVAIDFHFLYNPDKDTYKLLNIDAGEEEIE